MERFGEARKRKEQDESDTGNKNKAEGVVQKTCKKKTMKGKLGKATIARLLYKTNKCKLSKVRQFKPYNRYPDNCSQ